ncbi:MAG: protein phosphatase CheZ [Nitrosomonadales bacterium]
MARVDQICAMQIGAVYVKLRTLLSGLSDMTAQSPRKKRAALPDANVEKVGQAAAHLHRLLKELGHTRNLEKSAATMPDARERLSFIDKSMHEASEKTISAVEASIPLIKGNRSTCGALTMQLSDANFGKHGKLVEETISLLGEIAAAEEIVHHNLMQIMEAQEFRDVAGQMVNKIVAAAAEVENILLDLLKEYAPDAKDSLISTKGLTAGPGLTSVDNMNGQDEVDDLLGSLGF